VRVGLEFAFLDPTYTFGIVYYKGLLRAMREAAGADLHVTLLSRVDDHYVEDERGSLVDERLLRSPVHRWTRDWVLDRLGARVLGRDLLWEDRLRRATLDVLLFGAAPAGLRLPTVGWLPDFQHHHLPEMFSPEERAERDRRYRAIAERSTLLLLMSDAVRADFAAFAPDLAPRARVIHPMTVLTGAALAADPAEAAARYHLPERYVYLPNQFWRHKNHVVVWEALRILAARGVGVTVACSGHAADPRHPRYFSEMLADLSRWGLRDRVALLGLTPHAEVLALMRRAVAVLNPSRFEGYGMSVNEARLLGRPLVLSDLPSHREQDPPGARYFAPDDAETLAGHLSAVWEEGEPGPDREVEAASLAAAPQRLREYGGRFLRVLEEAIAMRPS